MQSLNQKNYVDTTLHVPSGESRDRVEGNRVSHPGEEQSVPYKVPIVVMNRKSRHNRRTKALSKTTEKSTPGRGLAGVEGW